MRACHSYILLSLCTQARACYPLDCILWELTTLWTAPFGSMLPFGLHPLGACYPLDCTLWEHATFWIIVCTVIYNGVYASQMFVIGNAEDPVTLR